MGPTQSPTPTGGVEWDCDPHGTWAVALRCGGNSVSQRCWWYQPGSGISPTGSPHDRKETRGRPPGKPSQCTSRVGQRLYHSSPGRNADRKGWAPNWDKAPERSGGWLDTYSDSSSKPAGESELCARGSRGTVACRKGIGLPQFLDAAPADRESALGCGLFSGFTPIETLKS